MRVTDTLYSTTAQFSILNAPTASDNITTYGPGSLNNFVKSNGTNAYWGAITVDDLPSIPTTKITGTLAIVNGGTGATTVSEISNQIGARSLGYGIAIASNDDLNSFKDPGNYYCNTNTIAKTISNTPHGDSPSTSALAFLLTIEVSVGVAGNYLRQIYKEYKKTDIWRRYSENGGTSWSLWCRFISSKDIHINYSAGTASTKGYEELVLGNTIASGTAGNTYGRLALYSSATKGSYITAADTTSSTWYNHVLPAAAGWLVTAGNGSSTGAGSTYVPIYVNTSGTASSVSANKVLTDLASTTEASIFAESPRPGVTGTLGITNGGTGATSIAGAREALNAQKRLVYFDQTYSNLTIGSNGWCAITIPDPPVSDPNSELYGPIGIFTPISCMIKNFNNVTGAFFITPKINDNGSLSETQYIIGTPGVTIGYLVLRFICQIGSD